MMIVTQWNKRYLGLQNGRHQHQRFCDISASKQDRKIVIVSKSIFWWFRIQILITILLCNGSHFGFQHGCQSIPSQFQIRQGHNFGVSTRVFRVKHSNGASHNVIKQTPSWISRWRQPKMSASVTQGGHKQFKLTFLGLCTFCYKNMKVCGLVVDLLALS